MKLGFIGCGNMANAMIAGIIGNGICKAEEIIGTAKSEASRVRVNKEFGIYMTEDNKEAAEKADVIVLSVKPQFYDAVIKEIKELITETQIIVTIAPGKTLEYLAGAFEKPVKLVRTMPNTPALVGEGITGVCHNDLVTKEELDYICNILSGFGMAQVLSENLMDVVVSVSGSSPAYVFMLIEAMADGAVADGMPRQQAYQFAAQAV